MRYVINSIIVTIITIIGMSLNDRGQNPQGRYVPWATWDEWISTYKRLYSLEEGDVTTALHTVDVWRIRGRVPMAVDATATLRRIWRLDESGTLDAQTLRLQYSLAIVRFVNGVTDAAQKGRVAASVANLAQQAGIPRLLVDVRHESTHNELPTLCVLRSAARQAMDWLRRRYWEVQRLGVVRGRERVGEVVQAYVQSLLLASMKEERNKANGREVHAGGDGDDDGKDDGEDDGENGDADDEKHGVGKRKKARKAGKDATHVDDRDDVDGMMEYCPRREKKNRQALLNELRGMLTVGDEALLARGLGSFDGGSSRTGIDRTCRLVLEHLGDVWPDLAAVVFFQWIDALFLECIRGDRDGGQETADGPDKGGCWGRAAVAVLSDASITSIVDQCIRRYCLNLYSMHQTAFIEIRVDAGMEAGLKRLRYALEGLEAPGSLLMDFVSLFLPEKIPVDASGIQRMRMCVDEWNSMDGKASKNTDGWSQVCKDAWRPCAIGMMPSDHLENGSLPDLACCARNPSLNDWWTSDAVLVDPASLLAIDRQPGLSAVTDTSKANVAFYGGEAHDNPDDPDDLDDPQEAEDTEDTCKTVRTFKSGDGDDASEIDDGDFSGLLPPPAMFKKI